MKILVKVKSLILAVLLSAAAAAQGAPPVVQTNIVRLAPQTAVKWQKSPEADVVGYWVTMVRGTNTWRSFTTNTSMPLLTLNSNLMSGPATFLVSAVNDAGLEGPSAPMTTNIVKAPSLVVNVRVEVTLE